MICELYFDYADADANFFTLTSGTWLCKLLMN